MSGYEEIAKTVILAGGVAGALTGIFIFARRAVMALREAVQLQMAAGRIINAELVRNGGSTLLDKVNRIAGNHLEAEKHWMGLEESMLASQEVAERRWNDLAQNTATLAAKAAVIASDLAAHREFTAEQHEKIFARLDGIEGRLP